MAEPSKHAEQTIRLVVAGDIMVLNGDRVPQLCPELRGLIGSSDLFIANLETPVGLHARNPDKKYTFRFHMPKQVLMDIQAQTELPFDRWLLSNANNHSGDAGVDGFLESIRILDELGVRHLGYRSNDGAIKIIEHGNFRLGLMAWTQWLNRDVFENEQPVLTKADALGIRSGSKRDLNLDFMIGLPHWEFEFQHFPGKKTRRQARNMLSSEFDLLLGSHPHVLQPYEKFGEKYCFYALGNFCGLGVAWPVKIIPILEITLGRGIDTRIISFKLHYFHQVEHDNAIKIVPLMDMPTRVRSRALERISKVYQHSFMERPCADHAVVENLHSA